MNYSMMIEKLNAEPTRVQKINKAREWLQALTIQCMKDGGWFKHFAFLGGTCLRLSFHLDRFSEDLDFILYDRMQVNSCQNRLGSDFKKIENYFKIAGFNMSIRPLKTNRNVWQTFLIFQKILYDLGMTPHKNETLQIKVEIDSNSPPAFQTEPGTISTKDNHVIVTNIIRGTKSSLFGGKCHAVLFREYTRGRDFFDLEWYLKNNIPVDLKVIDDTEKSLGRNITFTRKSLVEKITQKINSMDMKKIKNDVMPFVEHPKELDIVLDKDRLLQLIHTVKIY